MSNIKKISGIVIVDFIAVMLYNIFEYADFYVTKFILGEMSVAMLIIKNNIFNILSALLIPCLYAVLSHIIDKSILKKTMVINMPVLIVISYVVYELTMGYIPIGGGVWLPHLFFSIVSSVSNIIICFASKDS